MTPAPDDRLIEAASAPDVRKAVAEALRETFDAARAKAARRLEAGGDGVEVARL